MVFPIGDLNPTRRTPFVTIVFIAVNIAVFALLQPKGGTCAEASFVFRFAAIPDELLTLEQLSAAEYQAMGLGTCVIGAKSVLLSLLSAMFLHGSWPHLLGNMLFLWVFGNNVEDRLGHSAFVLFYGAGGIAATYAFALLNRDVTAPLLGASGAIAAVLGAYLILFPHARVRVYSPFPLYLLLWLLAGRMRLFLLVFAIIEIPAFIALGFWFYYQVLSATSIVDPGVAFEAHVGGFLAGVLLVLLWQRIAAGRHPVVATARW